MRWKERWRKEKEGKGGEIRCVQNERKGLEKRDKQTKNIV
jgi:hypothetical protein